MIMSKSRFNTRCLERQLISHIVCFTIIVIANGIDKASCSDQESNIVAGVSSIGVPQIDLNSGTTKEQSDNWFLIESQHETYVTASNQTELSLAERWQVQEYFNLKEGGKSFSIYQKSWPKEDKNLQDYSHEDKIQTDQFKELVSS